MTMTDQLSWAVIAVLAVHFGYAAQRGTICAVYAVNQLLRGEPPEMLLAFFRASLWIALVAWPLLWLLPHSHVAPNLFPGFWLLAGAFLFGIGAAINGGCSFATVLKLAAGDLTYLATLAGLAGGAFLVHSHFAQPPQQLGQSPAARPDQVILALWGILLIWGLVQLRGLWAIRDREWIRGSWPLSLSAAVMGLCGGLLYILAGSWMYTAALDKGPNLMREAGYNLFWILLFVLAGASWSAWRRHRFQLRWSLRDSLEHLLGGALMGAGGAWGIGGNDTLVLYSLPSLSYHALPAYLALLSGIALALHVRRRINAASQRLHS